MRVRYRCSENLPAGVPAALIEGEHEAVLLVDESASVRDVVAALDDLVGSWAAEAWIYVGGVGTVDLRPAS